MTAAAIGPCGRRLANVTLAPSARALRLEVRHFCARAVLDGLFVPRCDSWMGGFSPEFSRMLGERGWIGMTWPRVYGGHERGALERYVVLEELLTAGAPVAAHWIGDRQSGPQIYRHGSDEARQQLLPRMARGELFFAIGMSEPESGSDLASVRTRATKVDGGWSVSGAKVWTTHGHRSHFISVLSRTSSTAGDRHRGLSVLIADLHAPGVTVRPIEFLNGQADFSEVVFDDVFVPDPMLLGAEGDGWKLVTSELSLERSGPERILSTFCLLRELVRRTADSGAAREAVGGLVAELWTLRRLSLAVANQIDKRRDPVTEAALVKDLGTQFERRVIDVARRAVQIEPCEGSDDAFSSLLAQAILTSPGYTLRGGTSEILRGIVARGLSDAG